VDIFASQANLQIYPFARLAGLCIAGVVNFFASGARFPYRWSRGPFANWAGFYIVRVADHFYWSS